MIDAPAIASLLPAVNDPALVLVVEDDEGTREMLILVLTEEGYQVEAAVHGADALERIARRPPDLVILDARMPVMTGREVLEQLRARRPSLPVLLASADLRQAALIQDDPNAAFLAKPFDLEQLLQMVSTLLAGSGT